ncbi:uncharacterized protein LOC105841087 [Monomorium pharaonis]|uniref:uncharacterized protein LOC105841087 n=1 Tax=Monomorium pharaonis TaxID=307658 RepID=UPI0017460778|nr:uncharacterized protein LOC105841087 [Monomorium pharaonis]
MATSNADNNDAGPSTSNISIQNMSIDKNNEDNFVRDKLKEWNLENYTEIFINNKINKSNFMLIPDETINEKLIQPLGDYYTFITQRNKLKQSVQEGINLEIESRNTTALFNDGTKLRTLLKKSNFGKYFLSKTLLSHTDSNDLAKFIIEHLLQNCCKISKKTFLFWANEIVHVWRNESVEKWYKPYKNGKLASGKLYHKYINTSKKIKKAVSTFDKKVAENERVKINEEEEHYLNELTCEPLDDFDRIKFLWEKTFNSRQITCTIAQYFEKYPQLRPPLGIQLIELDYKLLNLSEINILHNKWPTLHPKILKLANQRKHAVNLLGYNENVPPEILAWRVLPYLFKPTFMKTGQKKNNWKPSYHEQSNGFITWINVITNLEMTIKKHRELMEKYNLTLQPFIIAVGPLEQLEVVYVIINEEKYVFQHIIDGVDFCFKSFYALRAEYPTSCKQVWTYIQKEIYGLKDTQTNYQSVQRVSDELANLSENTSETED